jgi:hypothetical protein
MRIGRQVAAERIRKAVLSGGLPDGRYHLGGDLECSRGGGGTQT